MSRSDGRVPADDEADDDDAGGLPAGRRNLMTPAGAAALSEELEHLLRIERPKVVEVVSWAASNGDRSENGDYLYGKKRLREIDRRIRFLRKRLEKIEVVDPRRQLRRDQVFFGATVTYVNGRDEERTVTIVGVDEIDTRQNRISWVSPVATALLKARVGDVVVARTPAGHDELEVVTIAYPDG
jgi:transcription elongation factor GreB